VLEQAGGQSKACSVLAQVEGGVGVTDEDAVEAQQLEEALQFTLEALAPTVDEFRATHDDAETVLGIKRDFLALAYLRMAYGATYVLSDYVCGGIAILRLLDARREIAALKEQVAFRDDVIKSLWDLEEMP
jgi:hypothetical protein